MYVIKIPKADLLAKISFIIFIFFSLFPKSIPFQPSLQERGMDEIGSSNIINQVVNGLIFILSTIAAVERFNDVLNFIKREKYLLIFLLWALITITWSDYQLVSMKRWFQIFTYYLTIIVFLSYFPQQEELIKILKPILYVYITLTLISIMIIPGAKDSTFNTWRGLTQTKNTLGQTGVICTVLTLLFYISASNRVEKSISFLYFILAVVVIIGTHSSTSYTLLFGFILGTTTIFFVDNVFSKIGVGHFILLLLIFVILITVALLYIYLPQFTDIIENVFGKSETFYDRGKLWNVMLWFISQHPIIGCGFQGFWVIDSPEVQNIYSSFVWLPNEAHNGYLDLINEVGIVGMLLFIFVFFKYFQNTLRNKSIDLWIWFLILPLIANITESTLFRVGPSLNIYFILAYLIKMGKTN